MTDCLDFTNSEPAPKKLNFFGVINKNKILDCGREFLYNMLIS
jgi:hypothetical protein